jgi:hypothetical protein
MLPPARFNGRKLGNPRPMSVEEHVREAEAAARTLRWINLTSSITALMFLIVGVFELHVLLICVAGAWLFMSTVSAVLAGQERANGADSTE